MCEIISDVNENFYSVHIDINYTDKGCMTCGEKQEMPLT